MRGAPTHTPLARAGRIPCPHATRRRAGRAPGLLAGSRSLRRIGLRCRADARVRRSRRSSRTVPTSNGPPGKVVLSYDAPTGYTSDGRRLSSPPMPSALADIPNGSITSPRGFTAAAAHAGLKADGAADVALLVSATSCATAGVFTKNALRAAPVVYDAELLAERPGRMRAVAMNARVAN